MITTIQTKTGWQPIGVVDLLSLGREPGSCDRCGRNDLRFLHTVEHPIEGQLSVGCECARRLCSGYSPKKEESRLRKLWSRRSRWLTRNWGTSWKGNATLTFKHDGRKVRVTVYSGRFGGYSYRIGVGDDVTFGPSWFPTADGAKLSAFDTLATMLGWSQP